MTVSFDGVRFDGFQCFWCVVVSELSEQSVACCCQQYQHIGKTLVVVLA